MQLTFTLISIVLGTIIIALHLIPALLKGTASKILGLVNIALHIPFIFAMLYAGASLELLVLAFMVSIIAYTLAFEIKRRKAASLCKREGEQ